MRGALADGAAVVMVLFVTITSVACATRATQRAREPRVDGNASARHQGPCSSDRGGPQDEYDLRRPCTSDEMFETAWIALQRSECFGTCPVFDLAVFPDGRLFYNGKRFVMQKGARRAVLPPTTLEQLHRAIEDSRFETLDRNCCNCRTKTDAPWTNLQVADERGSKSISHYHGCASVPASLPLLEQAVISLTGAITWIGTDAERQRQNWTRNSQ